MTQSYFRNLHIRVETMGKRFFSDTFKQKVLNFYKESGPKEASEKFGVSKHLILEWRRAAGVKKFNESSSKKVKLKREKRRVYDAKFKMTVIQYSQEHRISKAASKFNVNSNMIYKWIQNFDKIKVEVDEEPNNNYKTNDEEKDQLSTTNEEQESNVLEIKDEKDASKVEIKDPLSITIEESNVHEFHDDMDISNEEKPEIIKFSKPSEEKIREVLNFYLENGLQTTLSQYKIPKKRLENWRKRYNDQYDGKLFGKGKISQKERNYRIEVVNHSITNGLLNATQKYNVTIPQIWGWKSRYNQSRQNRERKSVKVKKNVYNDVEKKREIVEFYLQNGAFACEKEYSVPRQTVRNWALNLGLVQSRYLKSADVIKIAKEEGVKSAVGKFSISRATLYNWAKKYEASLTENSEKESITVDVECEGKKRTIVFWKKKVKPPKIKKVTVSKPKPPSKKKDPPPKPTGELPDWAKDFIKKKVPKVDVRGENEVHLVLGSDGTLLANDSFKLLAPDIINSKIEEELLEEKEFAEDREEFECDYIELDLFTTMPFFSTNYT